MKTKPTAKLTARPLQRDVIRQGVRVLIVGGHPWSGCAGTISEWIKTPVGEMWRVNLDNGMSAGAKNENLKCVSNMEECAAMKSNRLRDMANDMSHYSLKVKRQLIIDAANEIDRLQKILDSKTSNHDV